MKLSFATTWMDLGIIILSEVSQRQILYNNIYMWTLIFKMIKVNLFTKQKQTHRFQKQTSGYQRGNAGGGGAGINQELGINTDTLLYTANQTIKKDRLHSTGNSTKYSVITHMGKECEKELIYV